MTRSLILLCQTLFLAALLGVSTAHAVKPGFRPEPLSPPVDVVIALDVSGSMSGLIESAKLKARASLDAIWQDFSGGAGQPLNLTVKGRSVTLPLFRNGSALLRSARSRTSATPFSLSLLMTTREAKPTI